MLRKFLCIILIATCFEAIGQQEADKLWSAEIKSDVQWMYVSGKGTLIVARKDTALLAEVINPDSTIRPADTVNYTTLVGIDQRSGAIKWTIKPKAKAIVSGATQLANLPYLILEGIPLTIIDPETGRVVIDAAAQHVNNIYDFGFLYESGTIWLDADIDLARGLSMFDMPTGQKLWTRYDYFGLHDQSDVTLAKGMIYLDTKGGIRAQLLCQPLAIDGDYMLLAAGDRVNYNDIYKVIIRSGEIVWKVKAPDPVKSDMLKLDADPKFFRLIKGPRHFYYVGPRWLMACKYEDGKTAWTTILKTNSKVGDAIFDKNDGVIFYSLSHDADSPYSFGRVHLVNDTIGYDLWWDGLAFDGGVSKYQYTKNGLVMVTENPTVAAIPELAGSYLHYIDTGTGKFILQEATRLPGRIRNLQAVPKGVYYSTDRTLNIIDFDGKPLLDVPKGILQLDDSSKAWYYHSQYIYEIDKATAVKRAINKQKIDFQGTDSPDHVEIRKDGVILYSNQNIVFVNSDGSTRYNLHYEKLVNWLEKNQLPPLIKKPPLPRGQVLTPSATDFVVFTKTDNVTQLSVINKDSGKVISTVALSNADLPRYAMDANATSLFLVANNSIQAYKVR
ncbi:MAG: hypothetical protein WDO14_08970 [Bacteroidota bacterium]